MDKKFLIQLVAILIAVFLGLFVVFSPASLGLPSVVPGGGTPGGAASVTPSLTREQLLFIDQNSTGTPELVKGIITVDVADEPTERFKGLSNRESMAENEGMLFIFEQAFIPRFIMRDMRFPLDFVWVNGDQIVDIIENAPTEPMGTPDDQLKSYSPGQSSDKVIELNAGYIKKYGLRVGDRIKRELLLDGQQPSSI